MIEFRLNGETTTTDASPDTPLLWVLRDDKGLKGTRFGCGIAQCGACTIHIDGEATRSCVTPVSAVAGREVTTIEGLDADNAHPLQQAWLEVQVPQCGYCQNGQIMQAATLLATNPSPSEAQVVEHMNGNLCRCMAYPRIKRAVLRGAEIAREAS
ncbi:(2Fe-2S)-binding protein [Marinihelvus fidelis]|uniref:(2Fe-2S)-binding protein n=1 Tax=Marinihelvus fidelis TaxID=2613842 RepID=A0A5N0TES1_9GAMM|nr:(2Fe-2S)-binding protein [Marinihelvus fidelis]KAA9133542.1 (2Fe-2S)-binding protein [Marinihelvus fidelis]